MEMAHHQRQAISTKRDQFITSQTYALAAEALRHYRNDLYGTNIYIDNAAVYKRGRVIVGYKIAITDGGDESIVDYILDGNKQLISAYWHNQSPQRFWFCK
jgi:hypothetical protein